MNPKKNSPRASNRANRPSLDTTGKAKPVVSATDAANLLADGVWLFVLLASLLLAVALFSFSMGDPSWSRGIAEGGDSRNLLGAAGAYLADVVYYLFGYSAWWLLPIAVIWLYRNFRPLQAEMRRPYRIAWGLAGLLLLLFGSPMLEAALWQDRLDAQLPVGAGGIIGGAMGGWLHGLLGFSGSLIVFVGLILLGSHWMLQLSWLDVSEKIGTTMARLWWRLTHHRADVIKEIPKEKFARRMVKQAQNITAQRVETLTGIVSNRQTGRSRIQAEPIEVVDLQTDLFNPELNERLAGFRLPDSGLLAQVPMRRPNAPTPDDLQYAAERIERVLRAHRIEASIIGAVAGPVLTLFEMETAHSIDALRNSTLADDVAQILAVPSVRLTEAVLGSGIIGIEVPNRRRHDVHLAELLAAPVFVEADAMLTVALGKDVAGFPVVADLARMPHILMAGRHADEQIAALHALLASLLFRATPEQVRFLMMSPADSPLLVYANLPHLWCPIVHDAAAVGHALDWCAAENEKRRRLLAHLGVSDVHEYNQKVRQAEAAGQPLLDPFSANPDEPESLSVLAYGIVILDEFDLLLDDNTRDEQLMPLLQNAGATGIHIIMTTRHPDAEIVTGYLKTHLPTRMAFAVESRLDSRAVLDQSGAEMLLQQGDMLLLQAQQTEAVRIQMPFVADYEIANIVGHCARQSPANHIDGLTDGRAASLIRNVITPNAASDVLFAAAADYVLQSRKATVSALQRQFRIGYNRAYRILQALENAGIVSEVQVGGSRKILASPSFEQYGL